MEVAPYSKRLISPLVAQYKSPARYEYKKQGWLPRIGGGTPTLYFAYVTRPNGYSWYFVSNDAGNSWVSDSDAKARLTVAEADTSGKPILWKVFTPENDTEFYDQFGRLASIRYRSGRTVSLTYSDATTPGNIAPTPDLLLKVVDSFGKELGFRYDEKGRLTTMTDPAGQEFEYRYDLTGNLISATYPDGLKKVYYYNEAGNYPASGSYNPTNFLTGISDEISTGNLVRFSTYKYDTSNNPISSEHAGGVDKYLINPSSMTVTDPLGTVRSYGYTIVNGVSVQTSVSQPLTTGTGVKTSTNTVDANGNISAHTDFNGNKTVYAYDMVRNLETSRTEGYGTPLARTTTTDWHPNYRLPTRVAEPNRLTTNSYDVNGSLLTQAVQATTDPTGALGFSASLVGSARVWSYTYNEFGQVLTATDPRGGVTSYSYDSQGNLATITNAAGHVTTLADYDAHGRVGRIIDPNGLTTDLTYNPRGWLISKSVGGDITSYVYNGAGKLTEVTLPDNSTIYYSYDDARRLTGIADNQGNSITYTLDAMGNRIKEEVKDASGTLARQTTRIYDALNRLQQLTQSGGPAVSTPMEPAQSDLASTVTWMMMTPSAPSLSQSITLQATVMGSTPTGMVTFNDGAAVLGTASITNGETVSIVVPPLAGGAHTITATYGGDSRNKASTSQSEQIIIRMPVQLTWIVQSSVGMTAAQVGIKVQVNPTPARPQGISEQALNPASGSTGTDGSFGTVTVKDGSTVLGSAKVLCNQSLSLPASGGGTNDYTGCWATISSPISPAGAHALTAEYSGNAYYLPSNADAYSLLPQTTTVTLTGSYPGRGTYVVNLTNNITGTATSSFSYTPSTPDATLGDIAATLAALINASSDYAATAAGEVITITGRTRVPYSAVTNLTSNGHIFPGLIQEAALPREGTSAVYDLTITKNPKVVSDGTYFQVSFTKNAGTANEVYRYAEFNLPSYDWMSTDSIASTLCQKLSQSDNRFSCGYSSTYARNVVYGPVGEDDWGMGGKVGNTNYSMYVGKLKPAQSTILTPQAQIIGFAIDGGVPAPGTVGNGAPIPGAVYTVVLDGAPYSYIALSSDTTNDHIAAGLAAVVAQSPQYIVRTRAETATVNAAVIVEYASANYPFSYSASVVSPDTISYVITQQAR